MTTAGLHHVTAIAGAPRRNLDFYTRVLGLRLVKKTVNFDDPGTYHLYYGDEIGQPGTILTFFPWERTAPGRLGSGETQETAFRIPQESLGFWIDRLNAEGVAHDVPQKRFGETVLSFTDSDGTRLALIGIADEAAWSVPKIPHDHAIRGFHGVSLRLADVAPTGAILSDVLGFAEIGRDGARVRYKADSALGGVIDLEAATPSRGQQGRGSVHHIAFRAADDEAQAAMVKKLAENHGIRTTEQKDRNYFRSVYFREPGHVLFEIATDIPGFAVDEKPEALGQALKLPPFLEGHRAEIEKILPDLTPASSGA
jgi:glyoxalase family protein